MIKLMSMIHEILMLDIHVTKRAVNLFEEQTRTDTAVENLACMLRVPRNSLHIVASSKGAVFGSITFYEGSTFVDCSKCGLEGHRITPFVEQITGIKTDARFALIIEKDTTFIRYDGFCNRFSCILMTAKGQPDVASRLFAKRLSDLDIPILALVDADPYGLDIMSVYTTGSLSMSYDAEHLAIPHIKWIGILQADFAKYNVPDDCKIPLTEEDKKKGMEILSRDCIKARPKWRNEIDLMLKSGMKAEIQALASVSLSYLSDIYLPNKIQNGDWI